MTQDEVIDTAIQAWAAAGDGWVVKEWFDDRAKAFVAFAKLVAAKEREACAKVCDRVFGGKDPDDIHSDSQWAALTLAAEIRARGNT
jgi:hypothetical protein